MAANRWDVLDHLVHVLAVDEECDPVGSPVKAILVEFLIRPKWKGFDVVGGAVDGIVGFGG